MILFVSDFHRQMLQATAILASDWLKPNLSLKITDKTLDETLPWGPFHETLCRCFSPTNLLYTNQVHGFQ